jgi:GNAT superfamily N-acetyltransferase
VLDRRDIGHRVVVRHRVAAGRRLLTDVLGELVAVDDQHLLVRTEDGTERSIPLGDVTAAKRVPPRPVRYSEMLELERITDRAWPAPTRENLGGWILRAADGWSSRANSALPLGDPGVPTDDAIAAVVDWYTRRELTPRIATPLPVRRDVADALHSRGWSARPQVLVQTAPLSAIAGSGDVILFDEPSPEFLNRVTRSKGGLPAAAHRVLAGAGPVTFAEVRDGAALLATARGAVVGEWLYVSLVDVVPEARRRGLARAVTAALAQWAADLDATRGVLHVEERNAAAVALYHRLGFTTHHRSVMFAAI